MTAGGGAVGKLSPVKSTVEPAEGHLPSRTAQDGATSEDQHDPDASAPAGSTEEAQTSQGPGGSRGTFVRLQVEVPEAELEPAITEAWRQIAQEVRLPGFRPGKAPRRLLEKQFGTGYARSEALRSALPEFYSRAVIERDVDVIDAP